MVDASRLATYSAAMPLPRGFVPPCLPTKAPQPPSGDTWVHEIKHDGFRLMVRCDAAGVRLLTRNGHDWTERFPLIAETAGALGVRSCLIDGEAVACDGDGMPVFDRLRYRRQDAADDMPAQPAIFAQVKVADLARRAIAACSRLTSSRWSPA